MMKWHDLLRLIGLTTPSLPFWMVARLLGDHKANQQFKDGKHSHDEVA